jgi:hypothetical protein
MFKVLRDNKFEPNCLKRRSVPDDPPQPTAQDVALWTNHRVMEWLRIVDLAEYAPNLRGSGTVFLFTHCMLKHLLYQMIRLIHFLSLMCHSNLTCTAM